MENTSTALLIRALDQNRVDVFRFTIISHLPYWQALQEAIGLGRVLLMNESAVTRVEVYEEQEACPALVVLTQDDLSPGRTARPSFTGFTNLAQKLVRGLFKND